MDKEKFRNTKYWKNFRKEMSERKFDPITGSKLVKRYNLHHCDFSEENYTDLNPSKFLTLNPQSHDVLHFVYGNPGKLKDWKRIIRNIVFCCKLMDRFNKIK